MKIYKITKASKYLGISINSLKTLANNSKLNSFKTNWEKEFDEIWITPNEFVGDEREPIFNLDIREREIKSFIRKLLSQEEANWMAEIHEQKQKWLKELEKLYKETGGDMDYIFEKKMKKEIIITFDILQDKLDNQKPNLAIYSESLPDNKESFSVEELELSGFKKMIKPKIEVREKDGVFGRQYLCRITEEQLKELLNF